MEQNFSSPSFSRIPHQRSAVSGNNVLQAICHLQKLNGCSVNNLKKYLASQHGVDCQTLDATIKPFMKMAMDKNILKNLGDTEKVSECKRRKKSSGGGKKRKKSKAKKGKKATGGKKSTGGKKRRKRSKKAAAVVA